MNYSLSSDKQGAATVYGLMIIPIINVPTKGEIRRLRDLTEEECRLLGARPNWSGDLSDWNPEEHGFLPFDADDEGEVPGVDPYEPFTARDCILRAWELAGHDLDSYVWVFPIFPVSPESEVTP
jgi:hypothetical protein